MNERIRELIHKSTVPADKVEDYAKSEGLIVPDEKLDVAKFAELLVRECAQVAFEGDLKRAIGQWGSHSDILKHFEVEHDVVKTFRS